MAKTREPIDIAKPTKDNIIVKASVIFSKISTSLII